MTPVAPWLRFLFRGAGLGLCALGPVALAQSQNKANPPANPIAGQESSVISHLNAALGWYHQMQAVNTWRMGPGDEFYRSAQRDFTNQVLTSAFAYGRAMAAAIAAEGRAQAGTAPANAHQARLADLRAANDDRLRFLQDEEAQLDVELKRASAADQPGLQARRDAVQAGIELATSVAQSLQKAEAAFSDANEPGGAAGLSGQIAALERSVPNLKSSAQSGKPATPPALSASTGLINRASILFSLLSTRRAMDRLIEQSAQLDKSADGLASALSPELRQVLQEGNDASDQVGQTQDPAALVRLRRTIEQDAARFRNLSAAVIPLRQESMALENSRANLQEWRASLGGQTHEILGVFVVRAIALGVALVILTAISEIWRRAAFKYVHDHRRRRQFLLIRRFATWILVGIIVIVALVSDFSSLATFAGFITAGIAVALQTVILSIAAYFFLIGRYGVKVGDRITVSGVTGDVVDIGLVRVFLMELAGTGVNLHPTGRVVVLANSSLFSSTPVYKQLPGTAFAWHEVFAILAAGADPARVQERMLAAVNVVYGGYRPSLEHQHGNFEKMLDVKMDVPIPKADLRLTEAGIEVVVRYPAEISRMTEIDALVIREVLKAVHDDPELAKAIGGFPRIRAAVKG